ncbi:oxygen-independent coproporphyrinogen III oxidase [Pedobacter frigidisoli]|uniref:oxygen-independent coproporphyrinogen III oxidase n=1 Tax=Pedobacter frigidisoli TaxID=2530455 RepID=UPI00292F490F|nr:oxygen-independent coproporphyrinogen III oxidase [Pedobacter frigidisoli]
MGNQALLKKYNVAAPRYTSYPTVPYWDVDHFSNADWSASVLETYKKHGDDGISVYIHLPFCERLCTYCGCNTRITRNHGVERPYIDAVLKEWGMYTGMLGGKPKIKELHLGGGTPTFFSAENLELLIEGIASQAIFSAEAELSFEAHPANTTTAHLKKLHAAGFRRLSLGIQDFDLKVQRLINRFQTPDQVLKVTQGARAIGYTSINFDLIYGLPGQHIDGLKETIATVVSMQPDRIAFYSYAHLPWLKPGQRHYTEKDLPVGDEKFRLYQMGKNMLTDAGYGDVGMDHFARKSDALFEAFKQGALHRNFMGYTTQHTRLLIGLGVSAISDSWTGFAQNAKTVEGYLEKIHSGELAVQKGHLLSSEDLCIRMHILNIMCRNKTVFIQGIPDHIRQRLRPLLNDELISIQGNGIQVSVQGESFLRNICMAFDEKLWLKQQDAQTFSSSI